jgi:hypothetical protein
MQDVPIADNLRSRSAAPCFAVAQEHHAAIVLLLAHKTPIYASAFALVRVTYESLVRGLWLHHCASEEHLSFFARGRPAPSVPTLLTDLKRTPDYRSGRLTAVYRQSWAAMCAYTHTGSHQVQRWNQRNAIAPNYPEADVVQVLRSTGAFAILSLVGVASLAQNDDMAMRASSLAKEWAHEA